jgi:hypothetical protein
VNEQTKRILARMRIQLEEYLQRPTDLAGLVDSLEGALDALEERLPDSFYTDWFDHWGNLEQIRASGTQEDRRGEVVEEVSGLVALLNEEIVPSADE